MIYSAWYHQAVALGMVHDRGLLKCWLDKEETEPSGTRIEPMILTSLVVASNQLPLPLREPTPVAEMTHSSQALSLHRLVDVLILNTLGRSEK